MARNLPEYSLDELNQILRNLKGEEALAESAEELAEGARQSQFLAEQAARAEKPLGTLSDVLQKSELEKALPVEKGFTLKGAPYSKDFVTVGEPYGGNVAVIKDKAEKKAAEELSESGARVAADKAPVPVKKAAEELSEGGARVAAEKALVPVEKITEDSVFKRLANKFGSDKVAQAVSKLSPAAKGAVLGGATFLGGLGLKVLSSPATELLMGPGEDISNVLSKPSDEERVASGEILPVDKSKNQLYGPPEMFGPPESLAYKGEPSAEGAPAASKKVVQPTPTPLSPEQELQAMLQTQAVMKSSESDLLKQAQAERNRRLLMAQLGEASAKIGAGIAGVTGGGLIKSPEVDVKPYEKQMALAEMPIKELEEKIAMDRKDPTSEVSKAAREFIKTTLGINIPDNISADALKEQFPTIQSYLSKKEAAAARAAQSAENRSFKELMFRTTLDAREQARAASLLETTKNRAISGGGTVGNQIRQGIFAADKIFDTLGQDRNLTPEQAKKIDVSTLDEASKLSVVESAVELNRLLSGSGVPAQTQLAKLLPDNVRMGKVSIKDYFTSSLNPAQQGQFLKQVLAITARVKQGAMEANNKLMEKYLSGTSYIKRVDPVGYANMLETLKVDDPFEKKEQVVNKESQEEKRRTKDGRTAVFNKKTKQFIRYE